MNMKGYPFLWLAGMIIIASFISTVLSAATQAQQAEEIIWQQFPLRNDWQKYNNLPGGEGMQMVHDIDWNENDTNILYLAVDTTRIWKSADRGSSWFPVGQNLLSYGAASVVSDPNNPDAVFIAAGSRAAGSGPSANQKDGIYRSLDGGLNWTGPLSGTVYFDQTRQTGKLFLIDPGSFDGMRSRTIYAGTTDGILKSVNGGDNWTRIALGGQDVHDLEWSEANRSFFYAATNISLYRIRTADLQVTQAGSLPGHPWDIAASSRDADVVYAVVGDAGGKVYKSTDGGMTFAEKSSGIQKDSKSYQRIVSSRMNPERLILSPHMMGGLLPYWSDNGGETWKRMEVLHSEEMLTGSYYFARPVRFDPENEQAAISQTGGSIIKTLDGGKSWHYSGNGYIGARVVDIDFISESSMLLCLTDYGLFLTENSGESFRDLNIPRAYGAKSCGSSDIVGNTIVASTGNWTSQDIILSEDMGNTWQSVQAAGENFNFIRFNRENPDIVYADRWISTNGGKNWSAVNGGYDIKAVDPNNGSTVFGIKKVAERKWEVAFSSNSGETWHALGANITATDLKEIAVDPFTPDAHLLVAAGNYGIFEYKDGAWKQKNAVGGLPQLTSQGFLVIGFDPVYEGRVWAGIQGYSRHSYGIYLSKDSGQAWESATNNLGPYNTIWNIGVSPYSSRAYITGPGVFTYLPPDDISPSSVTSLSASNITQVSADLSWAAPGDNGNRGTASSYDIRHSNSTIDDAGWGNAAQANGEPAPLAAGATQNFTVSTLMPFSTYYLAIKACDEVPNCSELSNVISFTTRHPSDTDSNACTETGELIAYIERWKTDSQEVSIRRLMEAIGLWKGGC